MAADKSVKRKRKGSGSQGEGERLFLRQRSDPRSERRYEAKASPAALITMLGMSLGALAAGAGVYGQWLRGEDRGGPHPYAAYLLLGGVVVLLGLALFGQWAARPVRVGDAGIAVEKGKNEIERLGWQDVTGILLNDIALTIRGSGTTLVIPLRSHPQAAARALAEAKARIPARAADVKDDALPKPDDGAGEVVTLEPPQVAGLHCAASDKLIAFEEDARLCGRCGEVYHKEGVPRRCATCDAPLRA